MIFTGGVKSSQSTVSNKSMVKSTVRKHNDEKENLKHVPSTSTYNKSSCETVKPHDNLCGINMHYIIFFS